MEFMYEPKINARSDAAVVRGIIPNRPLKLCAIAWLPSSIGIGRMLTRWAARATNALIIKPIQMTFMAFLYPYTSVSKSLIMYDIGNIITAPDNCIQLFPTRQSLGTKRFDVIRQTQNVTANTTNVTDSPRCPAELVFSVILLVFIVVPSTLAAGTPRYSAAKVSKKL
jgi:hypothetical protein